MRVLHVATHSWLVVDDVIRPRYLIAYLAAVHRPTGETHLLYRISQHALEPEHRRPLAWTETHAEAVAWCRRQLETPDMTAPLRSDYGSTVTPEQQRARWEAGLDPRTGEPLTDAERRSPV
jgi:hypothetical protein